MKNSFTSKIDTHNAVVMILNNKSAHLIKAFGLRHQQFLGMMIATLKSGSTLRGKVAIEVFIPVNTYCICCALPS